MKTSTIVLSGIGVVVAIAALSVLSTANGLPSKDEDVKQKWAQVENQYQRRADLIPQLVSVVDASSNKEIKLVVETIKARSEGLKSQVNIDARDPNTQQQFLANQNALTTALANMKVVSERYPEFKASAQFGKLMTDIAGTENRITVARRDWTQAVQNFNSTIRTPFPGKIANAIMGFEPFPQFKADEGANKAPKIEFTK
jgi:LemA protein